MAHYNPIIDDPGFETDLITAASYGDCFRIQQILSDRQTDVNERNVNGWTALMYAAHYGHYQVVDELLKAGCDASVVEPSSGQNALMMAAANGHTYCVERLVGRVDLTARDKNGLTAADLAKNCGHGRNTALIRVLQMARTPAGVPQRRVPIDQRTLSKLKNNFINDSAGVPPPSQWDQLPSVETGIFPATSTPYQCGRGKVPFSRRLFPSGSTPSSFETNYGTPMSSLSFVAGSHYSSTLDDDCDSSGPSLPRDHRKLLGVAELPEPGAADGSDSGVDVTFKRSPNDLVPKLLKEKDSLLKRVKELEDVVKHFHFMTQQIIAKVQDNVHM